MRVGVHFSFMLAALPMMLRPASPWNGTEKHRHFPRTRTPPTHTARSSIGRVQKRLSFMSPPRLLVVVSLLSPSFFQRGGKTWRQEQDEGVGVACVVCGVCGCGLWDEGMIGFQLSIFSSFVSTVIPSERLHPHEPSHAQSAAMRVGVHFSFMLAALPMMLRPASPWNGTEKHRHFPRTRTPPTHTARSSIGRVQKRLSFMSPPRLLVVVSLLSPSFFQRGGKTWRQEQDEGVGVACVVCGVCGCGLWDEGMIGFQLSIFSSFVSTVIPSERLHPCHVADMIAECAPTAALCAPVT